MCTHAHIPTHMHIFENTTYITHTPTYISETIHKAHTHNTTHMHALAPGYQESSVLGTCFHSSSELCFHQSCASSRASITALSPSEPCLSLGEWTGSSGPVRGGHEMGAGSSLIYGSVRWKSWGCREKGDCLWLAFKLLLSWMRQISENSGVYIFSGYWCIFIKVENTIHFTLTWLILFNM